MMAVTLCIVACALSCTANKDDQAAEHAAHGFSKMNCKERLLYQCRENPRQVAILDQIDTSPEIVFHSLRAGKDHRLRLDGALFENASMIQIYGCLEHYLREHLEAMGDPRYRLSPSDSLLIVVAASLPVVRQLADETDVIKLTIAGECPSLEMREQLAARGVSVYGPDEGDDVAYPSLRIKEITKVTPTGVIVKSSVSLGPRNGGGGKCSMIYEDGEWKPVLSVPQFAS